jgi:hypothetical protein
MRAAAATGQVFSKESRDVPDGIPYRADPMEPAVAGPGRGSAAGAAGCSRPRRRFGCAGGASVPSPRTDRAARTPPQGTPGRAKAPRPRRRPVRGLGKWGADPLVGFLFAGDGRPARGPKRTANGAAILRVGPRGRMGLRPAQEAGLQDDMRDEAAAGQVLSEKVQDVRDGHPTAGTEADPVGGVPSPCGSVPTVVDKWGV